MPVEGVRRFMESAEKVAIAGLRAAGALLHYVQHALRRAAC